MTTRTAEEAKLHYIERMGLDLGEIYHALWQDIAWIHRKWDEYVVLFGTKPGRVDLLNRAAPSFFRIVEDSLWEDVVLHVARLTDPPRSAGRGNLTLRQFPELVEDPATRAALSPLLAHATSATEFCRDWRNRRIAHRDLDLALSRGAEPLTTASREKMNFALRAIADVINAVSAHYLESTTFFEDGNHPGGGMSLLFVLDAGVTAQAERWERAKRGELDIATLRPKDL